MAKRARAPTAKEVDALHERMYTEAMLVDQPTINGPSSPTKERNPMKINFSAVADSFAPRAAGEYQATLIEHEINPASANSGQPTLKLTWSEDDSPNNKMFRTYSLQPKALWSLKRDLVRIGKQKDGFLEELNSEDADLDQLITGLYGYSCTLVYGDPRPYKRKNKTTGELEDALGDNMIEVADPDKE